MIDNEELKRFVTPFYAGNDVMHNLSHVTRILKAAKDLAKHYRKTDRDLINCGCYFHGMVVERRADISGFLRSQNLDEERISGILKAAEESLKESVPESLEGKILHDAHLIEGGKTFLIVKSFFTGSSRGQTLEETIEYLRTEVLGKFRCYLPEGQRIYAEKERFAGRFLDQLTSDLAP